jgi:MerR family transcriptional regulator/heat shock protein HspR
MLDTRAAFPISVAAERADMQIQNLRVYERRGLLEPARTSGGTRLYSEADIEILHRIAALLDEGLNLAGIRRVLLLEAEIEALRGSRGADSVTPTRTDSGPDRRVRTRGR